MADVKPEHRILLIEDDAPLAAMVADFLKPHGFQVLIEGNGSRAPQRIIHENPDAVLLDVNLPGLDGFAICRAVRLDFRGVIIILTARGEEVDEVVGLEVGADDYMSKPVRPRALLARLRTHLRRAGGADAEGAGQPVRVGSLVVDPGRRSADIEGRPIELTTAEFDLLMLLAVCAGQTLTRSELYDRLHGIPYDGLDRSIDLRVSRLRKKLGEDPARPRRIKSVRGVGYMLAVES